MGFMIRQITEDAKLTDAIGLEAIETAVPRSVVQAVVTETGVAEQRKRKLPAHIVILLVIAMNLYTQESLTHVLVKMLRGLRLIWPDPEFVPASKGAITQARYRLGARPLVELFRRVCQPLATEATPGAFLFGLRLMAIDGTREDIPDTPANASAFGRPNGPRGAGAFPQVQCIYLAECGTHAIVDAGFWPCSTSERVGAQRMLRSVTEAMLVMWDRGLHSFDMAMNTRQRGAHFLSRAPAHLVLTPVKYLSDGSYLTYIRPSESARRKGGERLLVRVITYTIDDPDRPGHAGFHRAG